ncbi:MAG: formimidoylglutamate deiminase [Gemmatimonadota bacterium]
MSSSDSLQLLAPLALLPDGWAADIRIEVKAGTIVAVEPDRVGGAPGMPAHTLPGAVVPGVPNLHSHTFQRLMAGRTERPRSSGHPAFPSSFWGWRDTMYRVASRMTPDALQATAALAFMEMVESGFTSVAEFHYLHHQPDGTPFDDPGELCGRIVTAAAEVGIGLTLLPVFYAHSDFGGAPPEPQQAPFVNDLEGFHRVLESARGHAQAYARRHAVAHAPGSPPPRERPEAVLSTIVGVAPHSLRAVSPGELTALLEATPAGVPIHIHIAEQGGEVESCLAWSGARPVEWLLEHHPVDQQWCLVHATHISSEEIQVLAASGAVAGLCPITEANLGDGIFPAVEFLAAGGRFGVGSDSNVRICPAEELRTLEYGQRLRDGLRHRLTAGPGSKAWTPRQDLLARALAGGAQALGQPVGAIAPGRRADLVVLDTEHPTLLAALDPPEERDGVGGLLVDSWLFAGGRELVKEVWIEGARRVDGGRHPQRAQFEERFRKMAVKG